MSAIASAVKKLRPKDGDVVVIQCDERLSQQTYDGVKSYVRQNKLQKCIFLFLPMSASVELYDEEKMKEAGWVRAKEGPNATA